MYIGAVQSIIEAWVSSEKPHTWRKYLSLNSHSISVISQLGVGLQEHQPLLGWYLNFLALRSFVHAVIDIVREWEMALSFPGNNAFLQMSTTSFSHCFSDPFLQWSLKFGRKRCYVNAPLKANHSTAFSFSACWSTVGLCTDSHILRNKP